MSAPISTFECPPELAESGAAIIFEDVYLAFGENEVLRGVSFRLPLGETKALFGVAGAGKSTILKLSLGLLTPDSGRITVLGTDVTQTREEDLFPMRARLGMVFQESALFDSLNVRDNVAFRLMEEHLPEPEVEKRVRESLSFVELEEAIEKLPSELSGGMRRRVGIARAIITHPEVLLYDSPTGGLDPITSTTIIELIMKQRDVFKTSALMVTHRLQDGFTLATHYFDPATRHMKPSDGMPSQDIRTSFMILREGKAVFEGSAHELGQVQDPYIKEYIS